MEIRKNQPKNNKYYIRQCTGGLNGAVAGNPTIKGANVLCNCVGYANGRFNEIINDPDLKGIVKAFRYQLVCNAENFIESAKRQGLKISSVPTVGGIMVWQKGKTLSGGDGAGHVEVVEEIYTDGSILCSSSGYAGWAFRTMRRNNSNGRWGQNSAYKFRGCIINPSVSGGQPLPAPKLVVDGKGGTATVMRMQEFFGTTQDGIISGQAKADNPYRKSLYAYKYGKGGSNCVKKMQTWGGIKADGYWGKSTSKALQKKLGVEVDGYFGTKSMKALQKYLNAHDRPDNPPKPTPTPTPTPDPTPTPEPTLIDKEMDACKVQAAWMKNAIYKWESKPTVPKSKKKGTCVTYVACVLQRIGILKSGQYIWHNGKGYGTGKVYGTNSKMTTTYMKNKTYTACKSKLKKGDIVLVDDNKSGESGSGGHIMIFSAWNKDGKPLVWDNTCAKTGKRRAYGTSRKILAIVRLK